MTVQALFLMLFLLALVPGLALDLVLYVFRSITAR